MAPDKSGDYIKKRDCRVVRKGELLAMTGNELCKGLKMSLRILMESG